MNSLLPDKARALIARIQAAIPARQRSPTISSRWTSLLLTHQLTAGADRFSDGSSDYDLDYRLAGFARYVLNDSPAWSEPVALLLMLYYILLTAAVGVYEGFHLGLKVVIDNVSARVRRVLTIINYCLVGFFGLLMLIYGTQLAEYTFGHVIPTLGISRATAYWPFAAAGLLILVFSIEQILLSLSHKEGKY